MPKRPFSLLSDTEPSAGGDGVAPSRESGTKRRSPKTRKYVPLPKFDGAGGLRTEIDTRALLDRKDSYSRNDLIFRLDQSLEPSKRRGLRRLGLSQDHMAADHALSAIFDLAHASVSVRTRPEPMEDFLRTLAGDHPADFEGTQRPANEVAVTAFRSAIAPDTAEGTRKELLARAFKLASAGSGNLRFGDARRNSQIKYGYDWWTDDRGLVTQEGARNHEALRGLWRYPDLRETAVAVGRGRIVKWQFGESRYGGYLTSSTARALDMRNPDAFRPRPPSAFRYGTPRVRFNEAPF